MTQKQMTDEEIKATGQYVGQLVARSQKPLKDAGWLMKLPEDELAEQTAALVKSLPAGWQPASHGRDSCTTHTSSPSAWPTGARATSRAATR